MAKKKRKPKAKAKAKRPTRPRGRTKRVVKTTSSTTTTTTSVNPDRTRAQIEADVDAIAQVVRVEGFSTAVDEPVRVAEDWDDHGFAAEEVRAWLEGSTFDPGSAYELKEAGVTPSEAAKQAGPDVGLGGYSHSVGYKVSNGDLSVADAVRFLRSTSQCNPKARRDYLTNPY